MKNFRVTIFFLCIFSSLLLALPSDDTNNSVLDHETLMLPSDNNRSLYKKLLSLDYLQGAISKKIFIFSGSLDNTLSSWLDKNSSEPSQALNEAIKADREAYAFYSFVRLYDNFFKDESYLSTTSKSYVRLRGGIEQNEEEGLAYLNNVRVSLRLPHTEESLYFFIGDDEDVDKKTINNNKKEFTSIGLKYIFNSLDVLNANVFGGFRGFDNPFAKLRIEYPIVYQKVLFRPVQYVEYSAKVELKEETLLYADYRFHNESDLIRLLLSRSTQTYVDGMDYFGQISYLNTIQHNVGIQLYTNIRGRTAITDSTPRNLKYNITPSVGVYEYNSGVIYKQQFFRKYLFYELQPLVQFAQRYDYHANYIFRANIELYFGDI